MVFALIFILSIVVDQITKLWAVNTLKSGSSINLIGNFLRFSYVENRGAAFGILQNKMWFFMIITVVMLAVLAYIFINYKNITVLSRLSLIFIGGGAVGNFIDRIRLGYVVDFIDVKFGNIYDFPVFNLADSLIVCGTVLLVILILFNKFEKSKFNE